MPVLWWTFKLTPLISLHAHFFSFDEVESDFDPSQVRSQADVDAVPGLVRAIGLAIRRPVAMGIESSEPRSPEDLRYELARDRFVLGDAP